MLESLSYEIKQLSLTPIDGTNVSVMIAVYYVDENVIFLKHVELWLLNAEWPLI